MMSCYFRHLKEIFAAAGVTVTEENKRKIDKSIHEFLQVSYKNCPYAWREFKLKVQDDKSAQAKLVNLLKKQFGRQPAKKKKRKS